MQFEKSIFIFRRDLRLLDNLALIKACQQSKQVIPIFFFDPRQIGPHPFRSETGLQFLFNSLEELDLELRKLGSSLITLHGSAEDILSQAIKEFKANAIYCSKDYTPFSTKRDSKLASVCKKENVAFFSLPNILLNEPENIRSKTGTPYTIYSYFTKTCSLFSVAEPSKVLPKNFGVIIQPSPLPTLTIQQSKERYASREKISNPFVHGGRTEALKLLSRMSNFADYDEARNFPAISATTGLSAHNKFGTISIREFYHKITQTFSKSHTLCRELYWRDFFTHIAYNFPHVFKGAFNVRYDNVAWEENDEFLEAWQAGLTGFPIVDAGMRELNATGFMHNRVRMIVASFLTKDLLIDWHHGERYFARKLLDYDPSVNNGNWQWAASTGCDAQPYFRIFNPWLQGEKFDKAAEYIKCWIPELSDLSSKQIHRLYDHEIKRPSSYPRPIVEHAEQKIKAQRLFEVIKP